jgi:hypothetical protein
MAWQLTKRVISRLEFSIKKWGSGYITPQLSAPWNEMSGARSAFCTTVCGKRGLSVGKSDDKSALSAKNRRTSMVKESFY